MLFFQGIAAASGVGIGLAIGGISVAIVGLCTEQNPGVCLLFDVFLNVFLRVRCNHDNNDHDCDLDYDRDDGHE